jgi:hypothetical protein
MTVKELKALITDLPDDTPVLVAGSDHEYGDDTIRVGTVMKTVYGPSRTCWAEDYGEDLTPEAQWGKRTQALLIGVP